MDVYEEKYWNRVLTVVRRNLTDSSFSKDKLVREVGTSHSTLYRMMKHRTGKTYPDFILQLRLQEACRILQEQEGVTVQELSDSVGFNDTRYFSTCFKRRYGFTPHAYLRS